MKKVLFVSHSAELNGAELWLLDVLRRIDRSQYRPMLALPENGPLAVRALEAGIAAAVVPMAWDLTARGRVWRQPFARVWNRRAVARIAALAAHDGADLVFSNSAAMFSGARAALRLGLPHVWAIHEILGGPKPFLSYYRGKKALARLIVDHSDRIIVNSEASRAPFAGSGKAVLVHNGIDLRRADPGRVAALRAELGIAPGEFVIAVIGKIYEGKGQREALAAAGLLAPKYPNLRWLVVGAVGDASYDRRIREAVSAAGIENRIIFTGYRSDLANLLGLTGAVVVPSVVESFGRVALEAMASGVPVLAVRAGGLPEIIVHDENGFLLDSREPAEIALGIQFVLEHPDRAAAAAAAGLRTVREQYTVEAQVRAVEAVLDGVGGRP
jgi:glycosyltransferase involved in cell wall biosynthesis